MYKLLSGFSVMAVLLLVLLNAFYIKSERYCCKVKQLKKHLNIKDRYNVVSIGSFPAIYDFDWSSSDIVKGYNLGIGPEEIYYDFRMLKLFDSYRKSDGYVVIHSITPLLFCENRYTKELPYNLRYASILSHKDTRVPWILWVTERNIPIISHAIVGIWNRFRRLSKKKKEKIPVTVREKADDLMQGWLNENPDICDFKRGNQKEKCQDHFEEQIGYLKEMIQFCKDRKLQYVAVVNPVSEYIRHFFSDEFIKAFVFDNLARAGVREDKILNYYEDKDFTDLSCYINGLFLTETYRSVFTRKVINDLKERGLVE